VHWRRLRDRSDQHLGVDMSDTRSNEELIRQARIGIQRPHEYSDDDLNMDLGLDALALLEQRVREQAERIAEARNAIADPPRFRDYTGTDYDTCGYCHEPIEVPEIHEHDKGCPWVQAMAALTERRDGQS
jgi:hypothetical protein